MGIAKFYRPAGSPAVLEKATADYRRAGICTEVSHIQANSTERFIMESNDNLQDLVRGFLKQHTTYDVLPVSYRLIVLDTQLLVKKALAALMQNGKLENGD